MIIFPAQKDTGVSEIPDSNTSDKIHWLFVQEKILTKYF